MSLKLKVNAFMIFVTLADQLQSCRLNRVPLPLHPLLQSHINRLHRPPLLLPHLHYHNFMYPHIPVQTLQVRHF